MATRTRTKTTTERSEPVAVLPRLAPDPVLDDLAALLEHPEAFREWLESRPPDEPLILPGANTNLSGYWDDHLYHPVSEWLRAVGGRRIWVQDGRWRLLGSNAWRDQPYWLRRFLKECDPVENARLRLRINEWRAAGQLPCPTGSRVLQILDEVGGAAG